ncbi:hypothetical protein ACNKHO_23180 [Shigella flexneri]
MALARLVLKNKHGLQNDFDTSRDSLMLASSPPLASTPTSQAFVRAAVCRWLLIVVVGLLPCKTPSVSVRRSLLGWIR